MKIIPGVIVLFSCSIIGLSCTHAKQEAPKDTGAIPDSVIRNAETARVQMADEEGAIRLNGKIQANDAKQAKVFALVSGRIQSVHAEMGDYVHKGQVLAVLASTEAAGASNDLSLAESNVQLAKKGFETAKDLYDSKLATGQDFLNAKITYNNALAGRNKARQVASLTGGGKSATYTVIAPISGYIIEKNITNNSEVRQDNNTDLFAIADLSDVWVVANVYEADMNSIKMGDAVKVNTLASPDKFYTGNIDKIYNVLDPNTRTMKIRISMANPNNELKPEMFATIQVNVRSSGKELLIPAKAIVMDNSKNYVVTRKAGRMEVREINLIKRVDTNAYITGLSTGDEVVTSSQVFFYQALNTN